MRYVQNRRYPITYMKQNAPQNEKTVDLSVGAAAGVLAATLVTGLLGGYMLKKWMQ